MILVWQKYSSQKLKLRNEMLCVIYSQVRVSVKICHKRICFFGHESYSKVNKKHVFLHLQIS